MSAPGMIQEDLRAGVQAGILTEAQAVALIALSQTRAGTRAAMPAEDEPFEFFKGFAEVFITIGLVILLSGLIAMVGLVSFLASNDTAGLFVVAIVMAVAWWWAHYFTLKRRMNLPSMVLAIVFGGAVCLGTAVLMVQGIGYDKARLAFLIPCLVATLAMALWYRRFRLPFSMFILGLFAIASVYAMTATEETLMRVIFASDFSAMRSIFDLRDSPVFALATLLCGVVAFLAGMWFDLRDPHRLGRNAATAFWLHLLAAVTLVNTAAITLYNSGGIVALVPVLLVIILLALVIDRRSFVSAAIGYIALVITWLTDGSGFMSSGYTLLLLGALITAIGTWWVQLRGWLMRRLPDFPGKDRLPPYARPDQ